MQTSQATVTFSHTVDPARLPKDAPFEVDLVPDAQICEELARDLDLLSLRKVRLTGRLSPLGRRDWRFSGHLGATVVQTCIVTLDPVTTRIDEPVERIFRADFMPAADQGAEVEMPENVDEDPLGDRIDLGVVLTEALALALPLYPRADGIEVTDATAGPPGVTPMTDEEARPFAALAALRDKLAGEGSDDDDQA